MTLEPEYVRLHITPLDSGLLTTYLPASTSARNVSFHTIETFPEKRYGYVDLPVAEAEKLKKKLNGAVLKGSKVRIEKAKPPVDMGSSTKEEKRVKKDASSKKRKREENVVDGVALSGRKVKRGWTESPAESSKRKKKDRSVSKADKAEKKEEKETKKEKQEKKRTKSKYTDGEECLLKTTVPPNATRNLPEEDKREKKKRRKNSSSREVTVHEFEKTIKFPGFLKDEGVKGRAGAEEYVEGEGWVDAEGNVVEAVKEKEVNFPEKKSKKAKKPVVVEEDSDTSSSGSSSEEDEEAEPKTQDSAKVTADDVSSDTSSSASEDETMVEAAAPQTEPQPAPASDSDDTSSSGSDSEDDDAPVAKTVATPKSTAAHRRTSSSSLKIDIPPPPATPAGTVHPLEALYKRQKDADQEEAPATQSFSFFGNGDDDDDDDAQDDDDEADEDAAPAVPMTPYTRQDFEWRNLRSAAPTPDTAHPSRMQNFWADRQDEDEAEEEDAEEGVAKPKDATSDFQSWFWDNRRDLNRSWMNRRKTAAKERRHRENKARASRAV
ncbi:MFS transporter [Emericellopsis cladophorae]|uniref:MFS transporter n=1 Tax=Emericellopsis cladophorae TaxID=2686198 RepID=A0A9P9XZZ6_9HYPO|nr:MFS transporter [Emericellopsis cladophorae]KAI6780971.1 MFS transporter [Emericellopsis cladophorae]